MINEMLRMEIELLSSVSCRGDVVVGSVAGGAGAVFCCWN